MDGARLDELSRVIGSRRTVLGGLTAILGAMAGPLLPEALAKPKKKKKKKKCGSGTVKCGTACVNLQTDAQNCGSCGKRCGNGAACKGGKCQSSTTPCSAPQIRCGGQCVDPNSDENHCGGCGQKCQGDLTCLNGACGCAGTEETACPGNICVDLQTDDDHCGSCGNACGNNQTCRQGACTSSPCEPNQKDCGGGRCIANTPTACCSQADCGGSNRVDLICRNDQCVCETEGEGICQRYTSGGGLCHQCCPGGNGQCRFDEVCYYLEASFGHYGLCDCPTGWQRCNYNPHPTGTCVEDPMTDLHKCGQFCEDCAQSQPGSICCGGGCTRGCSIGSYCPRSQVCGPHCQPCNSDSICCNQGPGTAPRCIPDIHGGVCYQNI